MTILQDGQEDRSRYHDRGFKKITKECASKKSHQIKQKKRAILIPLSKKRKRYAIEYQNKRIGIIKPGIDHWCAIADLQYGAAQSKLDSPMLSVNWLIDNYKRVSEAGIIFFASHRSRGGGRPEVGEFFISIIFPKFRIRGISFKVILWSFALQISPAYSPVSPLRSPVFV